MFVLSRPLPSLQPNNARVRQAYCSSRCVFVLCVTCPFFRLRWILRATTNTVPQMLCTNYVPKVLYSTHLCTNSVTTVLHYTVSYYTHTCTIPCRISWTVDRGWVRNFDPRLKGGRLIRVVYTQKNRMAAPGWIPARTGSTQKPARTAAPGWIPARTGSTQKPARTAAPGWIPARTACVG